MTALYVYIVDNREVKKLSLTDHEGNDFAREYLEGFCDFPNDTTEIESVASKIHGQDCFKISRYEYDRFAKTLETIRQTNEFFERHPDLLTNEILDKLNDIVVVDHLATAEKKLAYLRGLKT